MSDALPADDTLQGPGRGGAQHGAGRGGALTGWAWMAGRGTFIIYLGQFTPDRFPLNHQVLRFMSFYRISPQTVQPTLNIFDITVWRRRALRPRAAIANASKLLCYGETLAQHVTHFDKFWCWLPRYLIEVRLVTKMMVSTERGTG